MTESTTIVAALTAHTPMVGPITRTWACSCGTTHTNTDGGTAGRQARDAEWIQHVANVVVMATSCSAYVFRIHLDDDADEWGAECRFCSWRVDGIDRDTAEGLADEHGGGS